jgi:hypothetical protein
MLMYLIDRKLSGARPAAALVPEIAPVPESRTI